MKNTIITIFAIATMALTSGCYNDPISSHPTNNHNFNVELLFEIDGCKVYRFDDGGYKYFTTCKGSVSWDETDDETTINMDNQTTVLENE